MSGVAACFAAATIPDHGAHEVRDDETVYCEALEVVQPILAPRAPERTWGRAADPGADNESVLAWLSPVNHAGVLRPRTFPAGDQVRPLGAATGR
jgi:hypothetical protein